MISFEGQVVAITGAGNGIGLATARLMAAHGARLVLTDIDKARLDEVARRYPVVRAPVMRP